jgi:hypothetical protein
MVVTTVAARATSGASAALPTSQAARHLASVSLPKRKGLLRCPALFRAGDPLLPDLDPVDLLPDLDPVDLLPDLDPPLPDLDHLDPAARPGPPAARPGYSAGLYPGEPSAWVAGLAPAATSEEVFSCLTGLIGRHKIPFFLDSGAFTATMSLDLVVKLGLPYSRTETRHTLADGSVGTALGLTSPVPVRIGKKDYPTSFLIMEKNVSPATLGIRQMSDIKGAWHFCSRTAEGFIETYDGERIALQPFDPVEGTNIVAALTVVAAHPRAFEPISFTEPFQPIATEPYVVHLTPEAAALPTAFPKRRSWNRRDATVIADYFEKRLANNMWRVVEEAELSALKWLTYPFCVDKKGGSGRRVVFNFAETANRYTVPDPFRMSDPETTRNATSGASLMSLLDMEESFSQFPLAPESQLYFATELPDGRIVVPTVIVMGPTNSPAAVQRRNEALVFAVNKSGQLTGQSVLPALTLTISWWPPSLRPLVSARWLHTRMISTFSLRTRRRRATTSASRSPVCLLAKALYLVCCGPQMACYRHRRSWAPSLTCPTRPACPKSAISWVC